ncbi:phosphatase PAP2 family protein [Neobacillus niacini]|uniref:phosphatase PAP2 family protein n=1 Tax=Neobacillus niacini TaxID=86668 RepID=UPI0021CB2DB3|nr:phosphatase PAP2 family protein [Neobacillus niacini]MCM3766885.1 phosphatase PAP2 family protein [Neobacillus niacini]
MNLKYQLTRAFFVSLISLTAFASMAALVSADKVVRFDKAIIATVQGLESPWLTSVMELFTWIGSTKVVVVICLLIIFFLYNVLHHRSELMLLIAVVTGTPILNHYLKAFFHRARPDFHRLIEIGGYSFPSGHAMNAFSVYAILAFLLWRHIPTRLGRSVLILFSGFMIVMIGVSRIYLGVHYPSDIIGGYFASGFWLTAAIWFFQWYKERQPRLEARELGRNEG